jgi:hypothetical protein
LYSRWKRIRCLSKYESGNHVPTIGALNGRHHTSTTRGDHPQRCFVYPQSSSCNAVSLNSMIPLSLLLSSRLPTGGGIIICKLRKPSSSIRNDTLMAAWSARFACEKRPKLYLRKRKRVSSGDGERGLSGKNFLGLREAELFSADEDIHHVPIVGVIQLLTGRNKVSDPFSGGRRNRLELNDSPLSSRNRLLPAT